MKTECILLLLQTLAFTGCESKGCLPPVVPYLGKYTPHLAMYKPNDTIHYICNKGSHIFGSDIRICKPDGLWNQNAPYCSEPMHSVSTVEKKWDAVLDGNYSSCIENTSISLSFNYTESFSNAIIRIYSLGNGDIDAYTLLNDHPCKKTLNSPENFHEINCSFHDVKRNTRPNITIVLFLKAHFCEIEIYPAKASGCFVLTNNTNVSLHFDPVPENSYVSYGTAAIHECNNDSSYLVGEYIRYCIGDNQWSEYESYCEVASSFTTIPSSFTTILIAVSISTAIVILIGITGVVCICKKKREKKKSVCDLYYSECDNNTKSADTHLYSTVNYDTVPVRHQKPLPEIPVCEINEYTDPFDAKTESLVGDTYVEPDKFCDKCNTAPVTAKTGNLEMEFRSQQKRQKTNPLYVKSLQ